MRYRVLVIDDDPWMSSTLRVFLTGEGFEVETADRAATALKRLEVSTPDVILLKLTLEGHDGGLRFARDVRTRFDGVPMIVLAGTNDRAEEQMAMALEAAGYLKKPIELRSLVEKIDLVMLHAPSSHARDERPSPCGRLGSRAHTN